MKKIASIFLLSVLSLGIKAQSTPTQGADGNWQPVAIAAGGANTSDGVEVNYLLGTDVVIVKLVNHSTNPVKVTWKDMIFTKDGQSLSVNDESVTIAPKIRVSDDDGNTVRVTLKLSDFHTNAANFKNFSVADFNVTATN